VLVLWLLAVLGLALAGLVMTLRHEGRASLAELQRSKALIAAEGGLALLVHELIKDPRRFPADGTAVALAFEEVTLNVRVRSEHGKLDLNFAHLDHVANLLQAMGASPAQAATLVAQLQARRNQGEPLRQLEELLSSTRIDTTLYQRILPYVTLWGGDGVPMATYADPVLRQALKLPEGRVYASNPGSVLGLEVAARLPDGSQAGLLATVLLTPEDSEAGLYRILRWEER
jgi:general secretion pathway protein K